MRGAYAANKNYKDGKGRSLLSANLPALPDYPYYVQIRQEHVLRNSQGQLYVNR
jgi:hypothetical protein